MTNLDRIIADAVRRIIRTEGEPAKLGRADGTIRFTDASGTTHRLRKWVRVQRGAEMVELVAYDTVGVPEHTGLPVRVAHRDGSPMIIGTGGLAADEFSGERSLVPQHSHDRFSYNPHYTTGPSFLPLMAIPSSPPAMTVEVQGGWYRYRGDWKHWDTADSSSLASYTPALGFHHFIVLCLDRENNALAIVDGNDKVAPSGANPFTADDVDDVTVPVTHMPLCAIRFYNGQTEILPPDIFMDLRLWGGERPLLRTFASSTLTISSGAVTATSDYHVIAAESGTSDDLDTITAAEDRQLLLIQADSGDTITVKHGAGNINLNGAADFELSGDKSLLLFYDGTDWSDAGAGGGLDIDGLTAESDVDGSADYFLFYDASAGANRKVLGDDLPGGTGNASLLFSQVVDTTIADDTTETNLLSSGRGSKTLPADTLAQGGGVRVTLEGVLGDTGTPSPTVRIKLGGTTIVSATPTLTGITDIEWQFDIVLTCRSSGASGTVQASGLFDYDEGSEVALSSSSPATIDTTAAQEVQITWEWDVADAANTITVRQAWIELLSTTGLALAGPSGLTATETV